VKRLAGTLVGEEQEKSKWDEWDEWDEQKIYFFFFRESCWLRYFGTTLMASHPLAISVLRYTPSVMTSHPLAISAVDLSSPW
jgi:hypothetical protein